MRYIRYKSIELEKVYLYQTDIIFYRNLHMYAARDLVAM